MCIWWSGICCDIHIKRTLTHSFESFRWFIRRHNDVCVSASAEHSKYIKTIMQNSQRWYEVCLAQQTKMPIKYNETRNACECMRECVCRVSWLVHDITYKQNQTENEESIAYAVICLCVTIRMPSFLIGFNGACTQKQCELLLQLYHCRHFNCTDYVRCFFK